MSILAAEACRHLSSVELLLSFHKHKLTESEWLKWPDLNATSSTLRLQSFNASMMHCGRTAASLCNRQFVFEKSFFTRGLLRGVQPNVPRIINAYLRHIRLKFIYKYIKIPQSFDSGVVVGDLGYSALPAIK